MVKLIVGSIFLAIFILSDVAVEGFPTWSSMGNSKGDNIQPKYGNIDEQGDHFEGDIVMSPEEATGKAGIQGDQYRWTNAVIPYSIAPVVFGSKDVETIKKALQDIQNQTCIKFVERTGEANYVEVISRDPGCYSNVGMRGGRQQINLGRGCLYHGIIQHEFIHALGFYHEQSRSDRDDYVYIIWFDIILPFITNFFSENDNNFGVPYDYGSVMHYSENAFSWNGLPTIVPKKRGVKIGQRDGLSKSDVLKLNRMYKCPGAK